MHNLPLDIPMAGRTCNELRRQMKAVGRQAWLEHSGGSTPCEAPCPSNAYRFEQFERCVWRLCRVIHEALLRMPEWVWRVTPGVVVCPSSAYAQARPMAKQRLWPSNAYGQATPMAKQRLWPSNAYGQATPMAKQRLWPSNTRRWFRQFWHRGFWRCSVQRALLCVMWAV